MIVRPPTPFREQIIIAINHQKYSNISFTHNECLQKLSKAMNAAEREFLAENEIVEIVPAFAHSILTLIQVFLLETVNVLI